jgi:Skp family chaperone for outer membrane proteins
MLSTWKHLLSSRLTAALVVGVCLVACAAMYSTAVSSPTPPPPPPVTVALVDIERLVNGLHEREALNLNTKTAMESLEAKLKVTGDEIDRIENDLKVTVAPNDYATRVRLMSELNELMAVHKARREAFQRQLDITKGDVITTLYSRAIAAIDGFAKREGIDLVLVDDRNVKLPELGSAVDGAVMRAIDNKRVLYARDSLDITTRLITLMNAEYASRRPTGTTSTPPPPPSPAPTNPAPR